jgi:hypothetical protein
MVRNAECRRHTSCVSIIPVYKKGSLRSPSSFCARASKFITLDNMPLSAACRGDLALVERGGDRYQALGTAGLDRPERR